MVNKLIAIVGQTSSGKSGLALKLAKKFDGEIVSADSRQIYIGMDYCTGKETKEELAAVPHHLIDILPVMQNYSVSDYQKDAYNAIDDIISRGKIPFLVGGTGLYARSVIMGYNLSKNPPNAELRQKILSLSRTEQIDFLHSLGVEGSFESVSPRNIVRKIEKAMASESLEDTNLPKYDCLVIGIKWPREQIYKRIEERLDLRLDNIIKEVKALKQQPGATQFLERLGLEAKFASQYIDGKFESYSQFRDELLKEERHYAKRQETWFKKDNVVWIDGEKDTEKIATKLIKEFIKNEN